MKLGKIQMNEMKNSPQGELKEEKTEKK